MSVMTAHLNILESSTVTLASGMEDPDYPLYRLHDRHIGRPFRTTSAVTTGISVDQGAGATPSIDRLLIPSGHNLAGMTLDVLHSSDGAAYAPAVPQWTGAEGVIDKSWLPIEKRYWKFLIMSPAAVPSIPELFLTAAYAWERQPARPSGPMDKEFNSISETTSAGADRFLVMGSPKRRRLYNVPRCGSAMCEQIRTLYDTWAGAMPFWLMDHDGAWIYGRLTAPVELIEHGYGAWGFQFAFKEVLP